MKTGVVSESDHSLSLLVDQEDRRFLMNPVEKDSLVNWFTWAQVFFFFNDLHFQNLTLAPIFPVVPRGPLCPLGP